MPRYIVGDLLDLFRKGKISYIGHGCNCREVMGAGIAKLISHEWPIVLTADKMLEAKGVHRIGSACPVRVGPNSVIVNLYTQLEPGPNAEYAAIRSAIMDLAQLRDIGTQIIQRVLNRQAKKSPPLFIPLIGCGIGGLDPLEVGRIVDQAASFASFDVIFVVLPKEEGLVPKQEWIRLDDSYPLR